MRVKIYIAAVLLVVLILGVSASAGSMDITLSDGTATLASAKSNLEVQIQMKINGVLFKPELSTNSGGVVTWGTGETYLGVIPDPIVAFKYTKYPGKIKEEITLKEDRELSFPITLSPNAKLIPWSNGEWKIVSATNGNTMDGIVVEKPYGVDAGGNRIEMQYKYSGNELSLNYDRTITKYKATKSLLGNGTDGWINTPVYSNISYPLVIDPTWTSVSGCWTATDGLSTIVKWNTTGSTTWTVPTGVEILSQYLIVGGGGAGGATEGGGGGAGGLRNGTAFAVSAGTTIFITVGAGGTPTSSGSGGNGTVSVFSTINASGGGGGGGNNAGRDGGSGGGGGSSYLGGNGNLGSYVPTEGFTGGSGQAPGNVPGGGAGRGSAGVAGAVGIAGAGGSGNTSAITGSLETFAAGGGAGGYDEALGVGGSGIGGTGGRADPSLAPTAGTAGTGSGGGGAKWGAGEQGAAGGSGVIIIRYTTPTVPVEPSAYTDPLGYILADGSDNKIHFLKFVNGTDGKYITFMLSGSYEVA